MDQHTSPRRLRVYGPGVRFDLPMKVAPSLYLRKVFQATADQAASTNALVLSVQSNDGFAAYLNGREPRANAGQPITSSLPANQLTMSAPPPTWSSSRSVLQRLAGLGQQYPRPPGPQRGAPSTTNWPEQITAHTPTPEFRINAGLQLGQICRSSSSATAPPAAFGGFRRSGRAFRRRRGYGPGDQILHAASG